MKSRNIPEPRYPAFVADRITSIPIRADAVVDILDLPRDMTRAEALRIGDVIKALTTNRTPELLAEIGR